MGCSSSQPAARSSAINVRSPNAAPAAAAGPNGGIIINDQLYQADPSAFPDARLGESNYFHHRSAFEKNYPIFEPGQLTKKREEFFDTRVEGRSDMWAAIRLACEAESDEVGQAILVSAGLTNWQSDKKESAYTYDERGHRYDVPYYCIVNPPASADPAASGVSSSTPVDAVKSVTVAAASDQKSSDPKDEDAIAFKCRFSNLLPDLSLSVRAGTRIRDIKLQCEKDRGVNPGSVTVFYQGRILNDQTTLREAKIKKAHVVQMMVRSTPQ